MTILLEFDSRNSSRKMKKKQEDTDLVRDYSGSNYLQKNYKQFEHINTGFTDSMRLVLCKFYFASGNLKAGYSLGISHCGWSGCWKINGNSIIEKKESSSSPRDA